MANKAIIRVGITADWDKFIGEYEKKVKDLQKNSKVKTEIDSKQFEAVEQELNDLKKQMANVKAGKIDDSSFKQIQDTITNLTARVTTLEKSLYGLSDSMKGTASGKQMMDMLNSITKAMSNVISSARDTTNAIKQINDAAKNNNVNLRVLDENATSSQIKAVEDRIKALKNLDKAWTNATGEYYGDDSLLYDDESINKAKNSLDALKKEFCSLLEETKSVDLFNVDDNGFEKFENSYKRMLDIVHNFRDFREQGNSDIVKSLDINDYISEFGDNINKIESRISKVVKTLKDDIGYIKNAGDDAQQELNVTDNTNTRRKQIKVQMVPDKDAESNLYRQASAIIDIVNSKLAEKGNLKIGIELTSQYKTRENKKLVEELREFVNSNASLVSDEDRTKFSGLVDSIDSAFNNAINVELKSSVTDAKTNIKNAINEIEKVIKEPSEDGKSKFTIYPDIQLTDKVKNNIQKELDSISDKFHVTIDDLKLTSEAQESVANQTADAATKGAKKGSRKGKKKSSAGNLGDFINLPDTGADTTTVPQGKSNLSEMLGQAVGEAKKVADETNKAKDNVEETVQVAKTKLVAFDTDNLAKFTEEMTTLQNMAEAFNQTLKGEDVLPGWADKFKQALSDISEQASNIFKGLLGGEAENKPVQNLTQQLDEVNTKIKEAEEAHEKYIQQVNDLQNERSRIGTSGTGGYLDFDYSGDPDKIKSLKSIRAIINGGANHRIRGMGKTFESADWVNDILKETINNMIDQGVKNANLEDVVKSAMQKHPEINGAILTGKTVDQIGTNERTEFNYKRGENNSLVEMTEADLATMKTATQNVLDAYNEIEKKIKEVGELANRENEKLYGKQGLLEQQKTLQDQINGQISQTNTKAETGTLTALFDSLETFGSKLKEVSEEVENLNKKDLSNLSQGFQTIATAIPEIIKINNVNISNLASDIEKINTNATGVSTVADKLNSIDTGKITAVHGAFETLKASTSELPSNLLDINEIQTWEDKFLDAIRTIAEAYKNMFSSSNGYDEIMKVLNDWVEGDNARNAVRDDLKKKGYTPKKPHGDVNERAFLVGEDGIYGQYSYYDNGSVPGDALYNQNKVKNPIAFVHSHPDRIIPALSTADYKAGLYDYQNRNTRYMIASALKGVQVLDSKALADAGATAEKLEKLLKPFKYLPGLGSIEQFQVFTPLLQELTGNKNVDAYTYLKSALTNATMDYGVNTNSSVFSSKEWNSFLDNIIKKIQDNFDDAIKNHTNFDLSGTIISAINDQIKGFSPNVGKELRSATASLFNAATMRNSRDYYSEMLSVAGVDLPKRYRDSNSMELLLGEFVLNKQVKEAFKDAGYDYDKIVKTYTNEEFAKNPLGWNLKDSNGLKDIFTDLDVSPLTQAATQLNDVLGQITNKATELKTAFSTIAGENGLEVTLKDSTDVATALENIVKSLNAVQEALIGVDGKVTEAGQTGEKVKGISENIDSIAKSLTEATEKLSQFNTEAKQTDVSTKAIKDAFNSFSKKGSFNFTKPETVANFKKVAEAWQTYKNLGGQANSLGDVVSGIDKNNTNKYDAQINKILTNGNVTNVDNLKAVVNNLTDIISLIDKLAQSLDEVQKKGLGISDETFKNSIFSSENVETVSKLAQAISDFNATKISTDDADAFKTIQKSVKQLSEISSSNIDSVANALSKLADALNKPAGNNTFLSSITALANNGQYLKDLAKVLNATPKQVKNAQDQNYNAAQILGSHSTDELEKAVSDAITEDVNEIYKTVISTAKNGKLTASAYFSNTAGEYRKQDFEFDMNGVASPTDTPNTTNSIIQAIRKIRKDAQNVLDATGEGLKEIASQMDTAQEEAEASSKYFEDISTQSETWDFIVNTLKDRNVKLNGNITGITRQAQRTSRGIAESFNVRTDAGDVYEFAKSSGGLFSHQTIVDAASLEKEFKSLASEAKDYYELMQKSADGTATASEIARFEMLGEKIADVQKRAKTLIDTLGERTDIDSQLENFTTNLETRYTSKIENSYQKMLDDLKKYTDKNETKNSPYLKEYLDQIASANISGNNIKSILANHQYGTGFTNDELKSISDAYNNIKTVRENYADPTNIQAKSITLDKLIAKTESDMIKHSAMPKDLQNEYQAFKDTLEEARKNLSTVSAKKVNVDFASRYTELNSKATPYGQSFFARIGNSLKSQNAQFFSQFFGFYDIIRYGQEAFDVVQKLDNEMVELAKVSNASDATLSGVFSDAADMAQELGVSIDNVLTSITDWNRLGYSIPDSETLAKTTELFEVVGDNMTQQTSQEGLTSIMKGWNMSADQSMSILDKLNEVANNYSVSTNEEVEAITRGGAQLSAAGNDLSESLGMIVAANDAVRNPSSVGTMLKTFSMRLRGANSSDLQDLGIDTTGMSSGTKSVVQIFKHMAGIDIMDGKNYKSTYDILDELASKWKNLTDAEKAALSEAVGGKRGGSIMASLMTNWQDAKDVVETANNSEGSAEKEQKNREKSIQVALNRAKAQIEEVIADMADKGLIKGEIDGFTSILKVIEQITSKLKALSVVPLGGIFLFFQRLMTGGPSGIANDIGTIGKAVTKIFGSRVKDDSGNLLKTAEGKQIWNGGIFGKLYSDRKPDTEAEQENSNVTDKNTATRNENAAATDNQTRAEQTHAETLKNENLSQEAQNVNESIDNVNDTIDELDDAWGELNQHPELGNMDNAIIKVEQEAQNATTTAVEGATEVVAQTEEVTNALSETTKETTGVKAAFSGLGTSIKNNLGSIALGIGAIIAIIGTIKGVANNIVASENEAFDQAQKNIENAEQNMKNAQKTINEIQQGGYNALRKGVNTNTNQNLSLTDEDHQTYLEYNNKIAELVPEIVAGYDAQGNAVIKYTNKIKDLNDALEEYNKNQIKQKNGFDDALLNAIKNYRKFQTGDQGTIGSMFANAVTHKSVSSKDQIDYINELLDMSYIERKIAVYNDNRFGGTRSHYNGKRGVSRRDVQTTLLKDQNASLDDLLNTKNLQEYKDKINTTLDSAIDTAKKTIQAQAKATDGYYDLDETQQTFISTLINGSDELITKILNNPKLSPSEQDIQIKDLANDAFSTTTKLSKINFVGANGKKTTLLDSLVNFDDDTKKTSIRNLQDFYDDIDDELRKHFSDDDATYLERTLGLKDKQDRDISHQYKDKILNVVNGIKRGITGQQRTDMIDSLLGMSRSDVDSFLTSAKSLKNGVNTYQDALVALKYARIKNAAQADTNVLAYDTEATNISNVQQAISNSQGTSGLTKTDLDNIKSLYQGLEKYNPDKLFENTTEGIHLNQKALAELNDEYVKTRKSEISDALNEQYTALIKCQDAMKNASDEDKAALETQQKQIKENIDLIAEQASMYDGLTSKYAEWQRAQQTPNEGANNEAIGNYWKTAQDLAKDFKFGTDDMRTFVGLISGKDLSAAKVSEVRKEWERISELKVPGGFKLTDLYTDDYNGSARFLEAVHATNPQWASQDKKGKWSFDFDPQQLADKWGVSVEVIENFIKQLGDYMDVTMDDTAKDAESKMESLVHKYEIIGKDGKKFKISIDTSQTGNQSIVEINENLDQVEKTIKDINDGTVDPKANATSLKKLRDDFKTLIKYRAQAEAQIHFHVDTSKLTDQGKKGFQTLTEYYQVRYEYREAKKTGDKKLRASIAKSVKAKRKELETMVKADPTLADELNIPLTAQGTINWKGIKDQNGNTVTGLDKLIDSGKYIKGLKNKFSNNQSITVTVNTDKGEINATNKDLKKVSKNIDKVREKSHTVISVGRNTISFDITNNALKDLYLQLRDIRENSHINVTVNQKTIKTEEDHTSGKKSDKKDKKSSSSERTSSGRTNSDNISGMTKAQGQNNKSYVDGKKVEQSPKTKGKSLVGELGTELLVRNGHYQTIGDNGAEMIDVQPNDIIFNHEQTKQLLENGKINSRGKSYADGTDYDIDDLIDDLDVDDDDNDSYAFGKSFSSGGGYLPSPKSVKKSKKRKKKNTTTKRRSNSNRSRSNKNRSNRSSRKSSSDWSDVSVEEPTNFDWIEVRLNCINDDITQLDYNVNRTYLRWGVRHKALNGEIAKTEKLILNAGKGATKYLNKAKSVEKNVRKTFKKIKQERTDSNGKSQKRRKYSDKDLDKMTKQFKEYAKKVREGKLQIQDIKNPDMAKAIQDYQTWYEKYRSARDQVQQAIDKRHDLRMQSLEQANEIRESRENLYETRRTGVNNREDFFETHGLQTNDSIEDWYHQNHDERKKKRTQIKKEIADDKKEREKMIDDALGVTGADENKAYKKAVGDRKKRNTRLKKAFGTTDLDRIKAEHNRIIKKKDSGKKLTKRENKKLKSYNNNYKKAKSDTTIISNYKTRKKALDYVNLDKSEKKKYTNAQNDKKIRNQRLKKTFGTTNIKKIQNEYDKLQAKKDSGKKLTKKENKKLKSYKNNFKPLQKDDKTIQKVRSDVAKTSKDIIDADEKIASKENDLNQDRQESVNDYFDMLEKKMTAIETKYSNLNVQAEGALSRIDSIIQLSQSKGYLLSGKFYDEQIKYQKQEGENIKGQLQESLELLKQYPEGTKEYYDAYSKVVDLGNQDLQNQAKVAQLEKEKADLEWTKIERKHTYIGYLNEELGWLESILETDHKITDTQTGRFNEYGVSALATYAKQYDTYMVEADEWAKDVQKVKAELDKDPDKTELQDKYQQYMQNWRSTITSAETAKKSMSNLMKQQYDAELAALKTVLDYRKKELEAQKSIYQYQKDITEKSRSVESIEKQLMAFQNDTSEEGKARTEKLKDQLRTAKQSLQDTEYNQYVSDQEELLDNLYTEFQNMFEDKMDDLEQVVKDAIKIVNDNQSTEVRTIDKVAKDVGYKVTDGTKNILNSQSHYYTNTVPGEFETLNTTISSEVKNITDGITSSETASEKILNDNIDKLITKMPDPQKVLDLENMVIKDKDKDNDNGESGEAGTDNAGGNDNSGFGSGNSNGGGKKPQKKQTGDYKEYFSKTGKYTNYDDKINESRRERVRKAVDNSNTKDSNKKAKKGSLEYFLYHNYGAGNTKNDLVNYWNAIHGDHKKTKKDKLSSAEKKDLMNWFKAFYSDGGTIGKAIKMSGEDGMILAKTGEEVLSIEKVKELQKALALLQPIHGELNQIHNIPTRTLNDNSVGDVSIVFNMPNVSNYEDFAKKLKSDTNMQKYIQQITIGEALGQNSLLKRKF